MIGHHDEFVKKEFLLAAVLEERVEEQEGHAVGLEYGATSPGCSRDEICVGPERGVIARRLGHGGPRGLKPHLLGMIGGMAKAMPSRVPFCCYRVLRHMSVTRVHQVWLDFGSFGTPEVVPFPKPVLAFAVVEGVNALGPLGHHAFHGGFGGGSVGRRGGSLFARGDSRSFASLRMTIH